MLEFNGYIMIQILNCIIFFTFAFLISCAGKKKKVGEGVSGKVVKVSDASTTGKKTGKVKTTAAGVGATSQGKLATDTEAKGQQTPSKMQNEIPSKSKVEKKNAQDPASKKPTVKGADEVKDSNGNVVAAQVNKSSLNNCASAAPTQVNIFDQSDDPAADKMNLEKTQNTCDEDLKDGDDTLKNVYSLPIDKDQSLKVVEEADGGKNSVKKANK
uniref:Uncharacterized protein n=1 Tax=Strongyloides papillosus TaxID=174720 RepID=A0A0N5CBU9_STREA